MAYGDEDEIDWSDGSLNTPPPLVPIEAAASSNRLDQHAQTDHSHDLTLRSNTDEQQSIPFTCPPGSGKILSLAEAT